MDVSWFKGMLDTLHCHNVLWAKISINPPLSVSAIKKWQFLQMKMRFESYIKGCIIQPYCWQKTAAGAKYVIYMSLVNQHNKIPCDI
jgi:hypothetical protein